MALDTALPKACNRRKKKPGRRPGGARPGAGRPQKPDRFLPEHRVHVGMHPEQRLYLQAVAQACGLTVAEAVRAIVTLAMHANLMLGQRRKRARPKLAN